MTQLATLSLAFAAATDTGCKRANNEDSFGYNTDPHLYVVCDGVGGALAGEVASNTAVRTFIESFEAQTRERESPIESRLLHSIEDANRVVRDLSTNNEEFSHMGTTLVCACVDGARAVIGNVGDSRAYLIREGACFQITQDHSLVEEQLQNGMLTPEMAENSALRSVITRAIGMADTVQPDFFGATLQPEDMLLLASDGLTRYLTRGGHSFDCVGRSGPAGDLQGICGVCQAARRSRQYHLHRVACHHGLGHGISRR